MPQLPQLNSLGNQEIVVIFQKPETLILNEELLSFPINTVNYLNGQIKQFIEKSSYGKFSFTIYAIPEWFLSNKIAVIPSDIKNYPTLFKKLKEENVIVVTIDASNLLPENLNLMDFGRAINTSELFIAEKSNKTDFPKITQINKKARGIINIPLLKGKNFFQTFLHEFAHIFGRANHASSIICQTNRLTSIPLITFERTFTGKAEFNDHTCDFKEHGNHYDIMSSYSREGLDFNVYLKKEWQWIENNSPGKIIRIDTKKPYGIYTIHSRGKQDIIAAWLPFGTEKNDFTNEIDLFFEFDQTYNVLNQINKPPGLMINIIQHFGSLNMPFLLPTVLYSTSNNGGTFINKSSFIDEVHKLRIIVENIDQQAQTLTFSIQPYYKKLFLTPLHGGNLNKSFFSSINVFENDIQNIKDTVEKPVDFFIESISSEQTDYFIKIENILQGKLTLNTHGINQLTVNKNTKHVRWLNTLRLNNPTFPESEVMLSLSQSIDDVNKDTKNLRVQYPLILSTEEYRNDIAPFMIEIKTKDIWDGTIKSINHLEIVRDNPILVFTSKIANNSRNPDGNKSSDFLMKWYIQDEKGNNVIPPFSQKHDGIPPKSIDDANPTTLTWTIPQDLPTGDYKIILEVDPNNRLQEFNENNNMIWRYFSVVE